MTSQGPCRSALGLLQSASASAASRMPSASPRELSSSWVRSAARMVLLASVAAVLALSFASDRPAAPRAWAQTPGFVLAATHPHADDQPTDVGTRIEALTAWRGQLYAGYGDYSANTGPISISPYDPLTGEFTDAWVSDTEAIHNYRPIRDRLYAPATDRRSRADYAVGEPWSDQVPIVTTHAYDIVTVDGDDLWLVGSMGYAAAAWRSTDDGESWEQSLDVDAISGIEGDFARFYFAGAYHGRLYIQAIDANGGQHPASKVHDGSGWVEGPDMLLGLGSGWRPVEFAHHLVYRSNRRGGPLMAFDGRRARVALDGITYDTGVDRDTLYALARWTDPSTGGTGALKILKTTDLRHWLELQAAVTSEAVSLAVMDGELYLGTKYAELWRFDGAQEWRTVIGSPGDTALVPFASR